jgi:hypothetical protein
MEKYQAHSKADDHDSAMKSIHPCHKRIKSESLESFGRNSKRVFREAYPT